VGPRLLRRLAAFSHRRYRLVLAVAAVLVAAGIGLASRLRFDTDVLHLLPQDDPQVRVFMETLEEFGSVDYLLVVMRIPEGAVLDPYQSFADRLGGSLETLPEMELVSYRLGDPEELLQKFLPKAVLFLDEAGRTELASRLTDEGIQRRVSELRRLLGSPQAVALKRLVKLDPLGVSQIFMPKVGGSRGGLQADFASGYYLSRDHRLMLVLAKPRRPAQDIAFTRALVAGVDRKVEEAIAAWPQLAGDDGPPAPQVRLGGGYIIALTDAALIQRDMVVNIASSLVGVLLLFLFAFRRASSVLYALLPLVCGLAFVFAFAFLTYGAISAATSGVAALLIGLGIDFVIVCYGRYIEGRNAGLGVAEALAEMSGTSGWAVVLGAVTTAATFFAFCVTGFTGLRQMGVLVGFGILACMAAVLTVLPAMIAWGEERHRRRASQPRLFIHGFGSAALMRWCQRHPVKVIAACVAVTAAAALAAPRIGFQDSMQTMRPKGNPGIEMQAEVSRHFGAGLDYMMLVIRGDSAAEVLEISDRAAAEASKLVASGALVGADSVSSMLPPPTRQAEVLDWVARERAAALDMARVRAAFAAAAAAEGLRVEPFAAGLDLLAAAVSPAGPLTLGDFSGAEETRRLVDRYVRETPGGWRAVVYLHPPPLIWKRAAPPEAIALGRSLGPNVTLTGANVVSTALRAEAKRDAGLAATIGIALVSVLLWLDYRQARAMVLSLVPLGAGLLWMLGAMAAFGIDMNFMNIFVGTMVIGIGTDYGVHIVHRYRESRNLPPEQAAASLAETGKAVVLSALTTIVGFGSLTTTHYPGLRSMGWVATLGTGAACLLAITLLPAAMTLRMRRRRASAAPAPATE
jgi:predicted RND superfamily exporter protein